MTELLKTWRVKTTTRGAVLTLNGREYELGASAQAVAFDIERAASGLNPPEVEKRANAEA